MCRQAFEERPSCKAWLIMKVRWRDGKPPLVLRNPPGVFDVDTFYFKMGGPES